MSSPTTTETPPSATDNQVHFSINDNVYYSAYYASATMSNALLVSEEVSAQSSDALAQMLDHIYEQANAVLNKDAKAVTGDNAQKAQNQYSDDSTYFQNLETEYNSMVEAGNTTVNNLANAQSALSQFGDTMNGDLQYMANILASG